MIFNPHDAAQEIIDWTKTYYRHKDGGIVRGSSNGTHKKYRLFNDLGDYLPFFRFMGDHEFCKEQIADLRRYRLSNYLLPPELSFKGIPYSTSYEHEDYLLGMLDVYDYIPNVISETEMRATLDAIYQNFFKNGRPRSWRLAVWPHFLPIVDGRDTLFVELFVDAARSLKDETYSEYAKNIALFFEKTKKIRGLLPDIIPTNILGKFIARFLMNTNKTGRTGIIKSNISWWWSLLAMYRMSHEAKWLDQIKAAHATLVHELMRADGAIQTGHWKHSTLHPEPIMLVENFPAIDWLVDCAYFLNIPEFIETAEKIAAFWLKQQNETTGLFPREIGILPDDLDDNTDMVVALYKLAEITSKDIYRAAANKALEGIWRFHRETTHHSYLHEVDYTTGVRASSFFKIKFTCLLLKAFILVDTKRSPLKDAEMWELLRDR